MAYRKYIALLMITAIVMAISLPMAGAQEEKTCIVYFTATFCHNCEVVDPIVLQKWISEHENLVVIEYMFETWNDGNAKLLGTYAQEYGQMSAVPKLFIKEEYMPGGSIDIPNVDIGGISGNRCMINGMETFEEIDLNSIQGDPLKIWSNGRLLIRKTPGSVSSDFLRDLLFSGDLNQLLNETEYDIKLIEPEPEKIAYGQVEFGNAIEIEDSWILKLDGETRINNITEGNNDYIELPIFGSISLAETSLPLLTVLIGLADGFNPCAFFILTFLLAAMVYAMSRKRILLVGGVFIFFSAFIYFLFMAAWLNIFLLGSEITILTLFAGVVATVAGIINMKDFFFFKKGVSLTLPTKDKEKFAGRVENLLKRAETLPALLTGTVVVAVTVNLYELLCTVGFPLVYTRILTLQGLSSAEYYLYLAFYNIMYIVPLAIIVLVFAITLGSKRFTVEGVKKLKLLSGMIIFLFGINLLLNPSLLENVGIMFSIIIFSIIVSVVIIIIKKIMTGKRNKK